MTTAFASAAAHIVHLWTATYTLGIASHVRSARRAEIASDIWEQRADAGTSPLALAISLCSRMLRGIPADLLWRVNVEGPKMDIRIPFERIIGALLLAMVVLLVVTTSISGYDTGREGFADELRRLANQGSLAHNMNAFFRALTGFALIGAAAAFYVNLKERAPALAAIAAFGICTAGVLALVAGALQLTFVGLAEDYMDATGAEQQQLLTTARAVALAVENVVGAAFMALVLSTYVLAIIAGRENLVPRWLIGIPVISAILLGALPVVALVGAGDDVRWLWLMSGMLTSILWLLIAGFWMIFNPQQPATTRQPRAAPA
jgi:hypothetical protein